MLLHKSNDRSDLSDLPREEKNFKVVTRKKNLKQKSEKYNTRSTQVMTRENY